MTASFFSMSEMRELETSSASWLFFNRVVESGGFNWITLLPVWNLWFRIFCTFQNKLPATFVYQENAATLFCREAPATSVQRWEGDDWIFHCWMNLSINLFFAAVNSKRLFYKHLPRSSAPGKVACGFKIKTLKNIMWFWWSRLIWFGTELHSHHQIKLSQRVMQCQDSQTTGLPPLGGSV